MKKFFLTIAVTFVLALGSATVLAGDGDDGNSHDPRYTPKTGNSTSAVTAVQVAVAPYVSQLVIK